MHRSVIGTMLTWIGGAMTVGAFCAFFFGAALPFSSSGESYSGAVLILLPGTLVVGAVGTVVLLCGRRWHDNRHGDASEAGQAKNRDCRNCGYQNARESGKCVWCGADVK